MSPPLVVTHAREVLELRLNRPAQRNALSRALIEQLAAGVARAAEGDVGAVVLTAAPPAFCSGLDLEELPAGPGEFEIPELYRLLLAIAECPAPVIAAACGTAVAGGAALLCACDLVVARAGCQIGFPGLRRGLVAPLVMPWLVDRLGRRRATYLMLTGLLVSGAEAATWGLVTECVADDAVEGRARELAVQIARLPRAAVRAAKAHLRACRGGADTTDVGWARVLRFGSSP
jgi:enoyl-CoA hydratase/carnithine racemase